MQIFLSVVDRNFDVSNSFFSMRKSIIILRPSVTRIESIEKHRSSIEIKECLLIFLQQAC